MQTEEEVGFFFLLKEEGKRRCYLLTGVHTAFRVLLDGYPFSVWVYLLYVLFISVCSDLDGSTFKQLGHVSLMKQENSRLWWLLI